MNQNNKILVILYTTQNIVYSNDKTWLIPIYTQYIDDDNAILQQLVLIYLNMIFFI